MDNRSIAVATISIVVSTVLAAATYLLVKTVRGRFGYRRVRTGPFDALISRAETERKKRKVVSVPEAIEQLTGKFEAEEVDAAQLLMHAAALDLENGKQTVQQLLALGHDVDAREPVRRLTPLHLAAFAGNEGVVLALLSKKADLNVRDRALDTPLHLAAIRGQHAIVGHLLIAGARAGRPNRAGQTPLHLAAASGSIETVTPLLNRGAKPWRKDFAGMTPIQYAALSGSRGLSDYIKSKAPPPDGAS